MRIPPLHRSCFSSHSYSWLCWIGPSSSHQGPLPHGWWATCEHPGGHYGTAASLCNNPWPACHQETLWWGTYGYWSGFPVWTPSSWPAVPGHFPEWSWSTDWCTGKALGMSSQCSSFPQASHWTSWPVAAFQGRILATPSWHQHGTSPVAQVLVGVPHHQCWQSQWWVCETQLPQATIASLAYVLCKGQRGTA